MGSEAVLTSTHNLCFRAEIRKILVISSENIQYLEIKFSIHLNCMIVWRAEALGPARDVLQSQSDILASFSVWPRLCMRTCGGRLKNLACPNT